MKPPLAFVWLATVGIGGAAVAFAVRDAWAAATEATNAQDELRIAGELLLEEQRLRATLPPLEVRVTTSLQPRVAEALRACGLSSTVLSGITPEAESVVNGRGGVLDVKRRKATLVLQGLTLPELGRYLSAWGQMEPEWSVTSLDLSPAGNVPGSGDLPLKVTLGLERLDLKAVHRDGFIGSSQSADRSNH